MSYDVLGPASAPGAVTVRPSDSRAVGAVDTWFVDCTNDTANDGTALQAAFLNGVLAELRHLLRGNGNTGAGPAVITEGNADDDMILKAVQHLIQRGQAKYNADSGVANSIVVSLSPAPPEYKTGMVIHVKVAANSTGATTVNVNGLGAKAVVHADGSALLKDDVVAGQLATLQFDGTNFQLTSIGAPGARNRKFSVIKITDQSLGNAVFTDVTWPAATSAFGTFDGTTFTFALGGTYICMSGLVVATPIASPGGYIHTAGNWFINGTGLHGYSDNQLFVPAGNSGIGINNWGSSVIEANAGDTMKIQAYGALDPAVYIGNSIKGSTGTFWDIVRVG